MGKIAITSDCTCDLSDKILETYGVELLSFYIDIDQGCFKDFEEITALNVTEYLDNGGEKMVTLSPDVEEIAQFYQRILKTHDEVIHISISSKISESYEYALIAADRFDDRVHVVDGEQLSTGTGHLIIRAAELAAENKSAEEIVKMLEQTRGKVSTTFILDSLECFYRTGRVNKFTKKLCDIFQIHPVMTMRKGRMRLKDIQLGDYEAAVMSYVKKELHNNSIINKRRIFITHTNCKLSLINEVKQLVMKSYEFKKIHITRASATITGNCGSNTIGVIFVRE